MQDYSIVKDKFGVYDFSSFVPSEGSPMPYNRIMDFIVTGPFVLETDGSFEAEHMYQRDKILYEDYLTSDGGERNIVPALGKKVKNDYYGKEYHVWEKGFIKWNCLRFDREEDAVDPALYATEQRNAVYYAAFYVDCEKTEKAVICHEDSGCALFVNGEQVDFQPYGRVKGLWDLGHQCLVNFRKGRNLVLFKLRPGYIADTMDISIASCTVFPIIASAGGLYVTPPFETNAYAGTKERPEQIFPLFAAVEKDISSADICCAGKEEKLKNMAAGEVRTVRFSVKAYGEKEVKEKITVSADSENGEGDIYFTTRPYDGYDGREHIFSDFHFDTTYHQEQRTYALGAFHITKSIVERLIDNPDFKATLSELDYLHPYYTLFPEHRKTLKDAFSSGRAEADCFYNQPNDLTSSGEAFVRNLVYGQLYHRDVMGRISTVYAPGDVFGHFSQMTQVCKKGGCNYIKWGKAMLGVDNLFRHVAPDGSVLLHDKNFGRTDASRLKVKACSDSSSALSYLEGAPRDKETSWMKKTVTDTHFSVFSQLADEVIESDRKNIEDGNKDAIDYTSRDLTQHHSGVLLTRTDFKQANRLCENLLVTAEKFSAIAFLYGAEYPELAIDKAWRQLLCAQHHDSVTGTNNEISFIDLMAEYRECAELASSVVTAAVKYIAARVKTENRSNAVFVFNPCTWERGGECGFKLPADFSGKYAVLTDTKGKEYSVDIRNGKGFFYADKIPAAGYALFRIKAAEDEKNAHVYGKDEIIENRRYRLTVSAEKGGGIVSIYDKIEKREFVDSAESPANMINVLKEIHDRMEPQHEIYTTGHKMVSSDYIADVRSDKCPMYQKLTIRVKLDTVATVIQEITLYKNSGRIDFRTIVEDYNSEDDLFSVTFPMNINGGAVIFDDRFAPHISTRSKKHMSFQTHQYASFSGCRILPANKWFGIGTSVKVNIADAGAFNIGMTALIRKPELSDCADRLLFALSKKAVPVTPYPDTEQHGGRKIIHFNEDIYETDTRFVLCVNGDGNLYAQKIREKVKPAVIKKADRSLEKNGVSVIYFKDSENIYHKPVDTVLITAKDKSALDTFVEKIENELSKGSNIAFENAFAADVPSPCDNYGAVILNSGNLACSVEDRATLNLMLFHTAAFYGNMGKVTGNRELVPEQKTHSFTYALCLHKGSYREAEIYKKAYEYNDKLFALTDTESAESSFLPEEKSFIKSEGAFAVTAFKAGGYPLAAMNRTDRSPKERGLVLRGFETDGMSGKIRIKTGFDISDVNNTDLLEESPKSVKSGKNSFKFDITPHSIETFAITPDICVSDKKEKLLCEKELTSPVYTRSWEHDMGSMPMGYLKFAATLNKKPIKIDDTHTVIELNAVNNSRDESAEETIEIICSEGITADRKTVSVSLNPEENTVVPLNIELDSADRKGQVKIYYNCAGQRFTDVYEFGYFNPEITMEIGDKEISVKILNPTDQLLEGSLIMTSPFETWGDGINSENTFGEISPLAQSVELNPFEEKEYKFKLSLPDDGYFKAFWAAAKLCCNGRIHFAFASKHGPRHNVWAHEFIHEIDADNGSIEKLLKM